MTTESSPELQLQLRQTAAISLSQVGGINVLRNFPGFEDFFNGAILPRLRSSPDRNLLLIIAGEAASGKETLGAMLTKFLKENKKLGQSLSSSGYSLQTKYAATGDFLEMAKAIAVKVRGTEEWMPLVNSKTEHGRYTRAEFYRTSQFVTANLSDSLETLPPPTLVLAELIGITPDWLPPFFDRSASTLRHFADDDRVLYWGVVTDRQVQDRELEFREELIKAPPKQMRRLLRDYHKRVPGVDFKSRQDIDQFRRKMGSPDSIRGIRRLVNEGIFDVARHLNLLPYYSMPESLTDLEQLFETYPEAREQSLDIYLRYLFNTRMNIPTDRFLVGTNVSLEGEDINLYRDLRHKSRLQIKPHLARGIKLDPDEINLP